VCVVDYRWHLRLLRRDVAWFRYRVGIIQVRQLQADFKAAEWGFGIGSAFWGTQECQLRKSFGKNGEYSDQALYSILATDHQLSRMLAASHSRRIH
jgi:hypothetical protein